LGGFFQQLYGNDVDGAPSIASSRNRKFTQELRLTTPLGSKADWLIGAFFGHESSPDTLTGVLAQDTSTGQNVANFQSIVSPVTYEEYALFSDLTLHLTNRFDLQIGGRQSHINQSEGQTISGDAVGGQSLVVPDVTAHLNAFTYLFTPQFRISSNLMSYARLASGYRAGGANVNPGVPPQYEPDKTKTYELGLKGSAGEGALSFDASVYYIDWTNIQLQVISAPVPPLIPQSYIANSGGAKSQGVELTLESRPHRGTSLRLSGSWDDAVLTSALPANSAVLGADGDRLPYSARFSGSFSAEQTFPIAGGMDGYVGGTVSYVGHRQGEFPPGGARGELPAYTKTDLLAGLRVKSWDAHLYVNNLADERGIMFFVPVNTTQYIQPRTIGLEWRYTFE
jgi:outer membrane receptor protein involved in Fe transport